MGPSMRCMGLSRLQAAARTRSLRPPSTRRPKALQTRRRRLRLCGWPQQIQVCGPASLRDAAPGLNLCCHKSTAANS